MSVDESERWLTCSNLLYNSDSSLHWLIRKSISKRKPGFKGEYE